MPYMFQGYCCCGHCIVIGMAGGMDHGGHVPQGCQSSRRERSRLRELDLRRLGREWLRILDLWRSLLLRELLRRLDPLLRLDGLCDAAAGGAGCVRSVGRLGNVADSLPRTSLSGGGTLRRSVTGLFPAGSTSCEMELEAGSGSLNR